MPTTDELGRIAAAMNALRPDWPTTSLRTFLSKHHTNRAYRDLAIAAIAVASDPKTTTPQLLNQHGTWWVAAQTAASTTQPIHYERCTEPGHTSFPAWNCSACRAENLEVDPADTHRAGTPAAERSVAYDIGARATRAAITRARGLTCPTHAVALPCSGCAANSERKTR